MSETNEGLHEAVDTTIVADPPASTTEAPETETTEPVVETEATPEPEAKAKPRPWFEKVIAERSFEAREAKREADALRAELAKTKETPAAQPKQTAPEVVPASEVEKRAAQLLDERQFVDACNEIADAGAAKHSDFGEAVRNFELLGEMPKAFLEAVTALGKDDGAKVYYDLGKDPAEAARVFRLPPVKMAMELQKMAAATPKIAAISKVPDPIEPITPNRGRGDAEPDPVKDSAAWTAWFNKARRNR